MPFLDENGLSHLWEIIIQKLSKKVDKVDGKGLSTNDFSDFEQNRVSVAYSNAHWHNNLSALNGITSAKVTAWDGKQDALVSGTNIKTVNGTSLLGSGDIPISGGGGSNTAVASIGPKTGDTTTTQSIGTTPTKLNVSYRPPVISDANAFTLSAGRITCNRAGFVLVNASAYLIRGNSAGYHSIHIYRNGEEAMSERAYGTSGFNGTVSCVQVFQVAEGDYFEMYGRASVSSTFYLANKATTLDVIYIL